MWTVLIVILFILWCVGKFMEGAHRASGGRRVVSVKHECYGDKYCAICGKEMRKPRN